MARILSLFLFLLFLPSLTAASDIVRPEPRDIFVPRARWETLGDGWLWSRSALAALRAHGQPLTAMVPQDIDDWCPAYRLSDERARQSFWVGFLSALAKHESTFRETAVGGAGRWHGLVQILPSTARGYGCRARSGAALRHGPDNLSCAIRIMAVTVPRDGVVSRGMRGVAADWGPLHSSRKREDMRRWMRQQSYCKPLRNMRPRPRPALTQQ